MPYTTGMLIWYFNAMLYYLNVHQCSRPMISLTASVFLSFLSSLSLNLAILFYWHPFIPICEVASSSSSSSAESPGQWDLKHTHFFCIVYSHVFTIKWSTSLYQAKLCLAFSMRLTDTNTHTSIHTLNHSDDTKHTHPWGNTHSCTHTHLH